MERICALTATLGVVSCGGTEVGASSNIDDLLSSVHLTDGESDALLEEGLRERLGADDLPTPVVEVHRNSTGNPLPENEKRGQCRWNRGKDPHEEPLRHGEPELVVRGAAVLEEDYRQSQDDGERNGDCPSRAEGAYCRDEEHPVHSDDDECRHGVNAQCGS